MKAGHLYLPYRALSVILNPPGTFIAENLAVWISETAPRLFSASLFPSRQNTKTTRKQKRRAIPYATCQSLQVSAGNVSHNSLVLRCTSHLHLEGGKERELLACEGTLIKSAEDTKLSGAANTLDDRNDHQRELERPNAGLKATEGNVIGLNARLYTKEKETDYTVAIRGILGSAILQVRKILGLR